MTTESSNHSGAHSAARTDGSRANAGRSAERRTVCAFWIGNRCFGVDTSLVAEVVSIEAYIPIPLAPKAVRGIFNLRGEPLPLISLADILGVTYGPEGQVIATAMVLRGDGLAAGLLIDRVQAILPLEPGALMPPANVTEDAVILGFLEATTGSLTTAVAVIDPASLIERLMQLRYQRDVST